MFWIVTGDWHFRSGDWLRRKELRAFCDIIIKLKDKTKKDLGLIVLGDIFDSGAPISIEDMYYLLWFFHYWKSPVLIIPGNHDCHVKSTKLRSIFKIFCLFRNVYIGKDITKEFRQFSVWEYYADRPFGSGNILLAHKDIKELNSFYDKEFAVSLEDFGKYKFCLNGHLHYMRLVGNVLLPGPPYPISFSDWKNGTRGSFVLFDDSNCQYRFFGTNITSYLTDDDFSGGGYENVISGTGTKFCRVITSDTYIRSDGTKVKVTYKRLGQYEKSVVTKDDLDSTELPTIHDACMVGIESGKLTEKEAKILELLYAKKAERAISTLAQDD